MEFEGHYIDASEIGGITKIYFEYGYSQCETYYFIHLKGGGKIRINRVCNGVSSYSSQQEQCKKMLEEMEPGRKELAYKACID